MDSLDTKIKKGIKAARVILKKSPDRAMLLHVQEAERALARKETSDSAKRSFVRVLHHFVRENEPK